MLMSDILSENAADKEIIKSLLRHIKLLSGRKHPMSTEAKILFDINGDAYRATEFQVLSEEELNAELNDAKAEAEKLEQAIAYSNKLQGGEKPAPAVEPTPAPAPETPAEPIVAIPEAPATPEAPAENLVPAPTPEVPAVSDPATAPAPVAPIVLN